MKRIMPFIVISFFLILRGQAQSIINGQFIIRGAGDDLGRNILQLSDGNYLYTGTTTSYGTGGEDILLIKYAPDFSVVWEKTIGGAGDEFLFDRESCIENPDGTIMIIANSGVGTIGGDDILLIKLDLTGNIVWSKVYGGTQNERGLTIEQALDGGYFLGGNTYSFPNGNNNLYVLKVDEDGNTEWKWSFGDDLETATQVSDIINLPDSSILISGSYDSGGSPLAASYIARLDKSGTLLWMKRYTYSSSGHGWEGVFGLKLLTNNTVLASGMTRGYSQSGTTDALLMNIEFDGSVNWAKVYGGSGIDWSYNVDTDAAGNVVSLIYTNSVGAGGYDIALLKVDGIGNVSKYSVYGSSGDEHGKFFSKTQDGGVIFTGSTTGFSAVQKDGYIVKLDSSWETGCNSSSELISATNVSITPQSFSKTITTNGNEIALSLSVSLESTQRDSLCIVTSVESYADVIGSKMYPNPASTNFNINVRDDEYDRIEIFDINAKLVEHYVISKSSNILSIGLKQLDSGIYFVRLLKNELLIFNDKLVVIK